jgi:hypothetical protein
VVVVVVVVVMPHDWLREKWSVTPHFLSNTLGEHSFWGYDFQRHDVQ